MDTKKQVAYGALDAARLAAGDPEAFRILVRHYGPNVRAWLAGHLGDAEVVDDLAQETFVAAWEGLDRYNDEGNISGWLIGIARNRLKMYFRANSRRNSAMARYQEDLVGLLGEDDIGDLPEQLSALRDCVNKLPKRTAAVVHARYNQRRQVQELAEAFELSANSVAQLLFRARQQLRTCIRQQAGG